MLPRCLRSWSSASLMIAMKMASWLKFLLASSSSMKKNSLIPSTPPPPTSLPNHNVQSPQENYLLIRCCLASQTTTTAGSSWWMMLIVVGAELQSAHSLKTNSLIRSTTSEDSSKTTRFLSCLMTRYRSKRLRMVSPLRSSFPIYKLDPILASSH